MAMNDPFADLVEQLETTRVSLHAAVAAVAPELRQRRPAPDAWSVAEVLEHLAIIERRITQLITGFIAKARQSGLVEPNVPASIVQTISMAAFSDRSRKVVTPDKGLPTGALAADVAWQELETSRRELLGMLADAKSVDLSAMQHPHFIFGPLNGYQWLAFVVGHEVRHTDQIREIALLLSRCV